jgi:hypothetical protein
MNERAKESVWDYPRPPAIERIERHLRAGSGGGWITDEIVGPFKGEPATMGW